MLTVSWHNHWCAGQSHGESVFRDGDDCLGRFESSSCPPPILAAQSISLADDLSRVTVTERNSPRILERRTAGKDRPSAFERPLDMPKLTTAVHGATAIFFAITSMSASGPIRTLRLRPTLRRKAALDFAPGSRQLWVKLRVSVSRARADRLQLLHASSSAEERFFAPGEAALKPRQ